MGKTCVPGLNSSRNTLRRLNWPLGNDSNLKALLGVPKGTHEKAESSRVPPFSSLHRVGYLRRHAEHKHSEPRRPLTVTALPWTSLLVTDPFTRPKSAPGMGHFWKKRNHSMGPWSPPWLYSMVVLLLTGAHHYLFPPVPSLLVSGGQGGVGCNVFLLCAFQQDTSDIKSNPC